MRRRTENFVGQGSGEIKEGVGEGGKERGEPERKGEGEKQRMAVEKMERGRDSRKWKGKQRGKERGRDIRKRE
jgi:hypothetical protein